MWLLHHKILYEYFMKFFLELYLPDSVSPILY